MARITSKQAKELMEAYASVHNVQERFDPSKYDLTKLQGGLSNAEYAALSGSDRRGLTRALKVQSLQNKAKEVNLKSGEGPVTVSSVNSEGKPKRVDTNNQSNNNQPTNNNQTTEKPAAQNNQTTEKPATQSNNNNQQSNNNQSSSAPNGSGGRRTGIDGKGLMDKLRSQSGDRVQSGGGQQPSGGNQTQTAQRPATGGQPQGGTPVNKLFGRGGSDGSPAPYTGGPNAAQRANAGTVQRPTVQAQPAQQQKPGVLGRLGSLAGRAANAARNAAGGIKQVATSTASNIKKGAQAVAGGIRQGAQAVSGALANKGPIQGRASGTQRRAQQAVQRTQQAKPAPQQQSGLSFKDAMKAAQTKPGQDLVKSTQQPTAKPAPQLSGAQRAQQMAKERISQGRNTVTGKLKSEKPKPKVTTWRELEGYDPMENLFDDTVQFLVSEGHAKDKSEAISIMSESEFMDAFNQELNE